MPGPSHAQGVLPACVADANRFCPDSSDPQSRRQCMNQHKSELSEACLQARQGSAAAHGASVAGPQRLPGPAQAFGAAQAPAAAPPPDPAASAAGARSEVAKRMDSRSFPSAFQPWQPLDNIRDSSDGAVPASSKEPALITAARHDLYWAGWQLLGLKLAGGQTSPLMSPELDPDSIQAALKNRATMLAANPHMVILAEVHYRTAPPNFLPADSPLWARGDGGNANLQRYGNKRLDLANPDLQRRVANFCAALVKSGVYDGCMLDLWRDDAPQTARDSLSLIRTMRQAVGDQAILIGNVTGRVPAATGAYLNGMYMEGFGSRFFPDWRTAAANLGWAQTHLHAPAITALEGWWQTTGRDDLALMRSVTTLSLVFSNGYVLFADPNGPPDHKHDWYPFWDKSLGKPTGPLASLDRPDLAGAYTRRFEKGEAVFNPPANRSVTVNFPTPMRSAATNSTARSFTVAPGDGDLFLDLGR
jgi:Hypothetical glycosyl hydrolase family 15